MGSTYCISVYSCCHLWFKSERLDFMSFKKYKSIIWDFNGTLLDDVHICLNIMNEMLAKRGMKEITLEEYKNVFQFPVIEYYKKVGIIKGEEDFDEVAHEWMNLYYEHERDVCVFEDTVETLEWFKKQGIPQNVLSASHMDQLHRLLEQVGIDGYMDHILGISDIYAKSKVHIGLEFIENSPYNKDELVMVGDSTHDFEVASEMGIDCILLASGHQSKDVLSQCNCMVLDSAKSLTTLDVWR